MTPPLILVVEDESIVARDIANRLKNLGYAVAGTAATGEGALSLASAAHPDLVLMDILLKGSMDGIETARRIREEHDIPVIYLTAFADDQTLERARVTEAFGYILKPFQERELQITIEMALIKHRLEKRLRENQQWLSATLNSIGDAVIATDTSGRISFMNPGAERLTGWRHADAVNRPLADVFVILDESTRAPVEHPLHEVLEEGVVVRIVGHTVLRGRQGSETPIDYNVAPIRDARGAITGAVLVFQDMIEHRRAEETIRRSQAELAAIVGSAMDAIISIDSQQRIVLFNSAAEKMFNVSAADVIGVPIDHFIPERFHGVHRQYVEEFGESGATRRSMGRLEPLSAVRASGEEFPVEASISHIEVAGNRFYTVILRDITERSKLEERLRNAQRMESIGTLASGIAHDFNNVLNNVLGFTSQLKRYAQDAGKVQKYTETIERSATRGVELASQLLAFAKTNRQVAVPVDLMQIIGEVAATARETFPSLITVREEIAPDLMAVLGDHGALYQVLLNLSVNARDAMVARPQPGGTLTITARNVVVGKDIGPEIFVSPNGLGVELTVADTGIGIPNEIRTKIFDPFFTTKERGRGTGLGLSIVYNIILAHNGAITLESSVGHGTTFKVYLPASREKLRVTQASPKPEQAEESSLVLLVDDDEAMQELGRELLEDQGYRVLVAGDGKEAVELYRQRHQEIALVILDIVMPRMDGRQAYNAMKEIDPMVPAFFCTGYVSDSAIADLLEKEHLRAVGKPFKPEDFLHTVSTVIHEARSPHIRT